jgi:hypothetical protein
VCAAAVCVCARVHVRVRACSSVCCVWVGGGGNRGSWVSQCCTDALTAGPNCAVCLVTVSESQGEQVRCVALGLRGVQELLAPSGHHSSWSRFFVGPAPSTPGAVETVPPVLVPAVPAAAVVEASRGADDAQGNAGAGVDASGVAAGAGASTVLAAATSSMLSLSVPCSGPRVGSPVRDGDASGGSGSDGEGPSRVEAAALLPALLTLSQTSPAMVRRPSGSELSATEVGELVALVHWVRVLQGVVVAAPTLPGFVRIQLVEVRRRACCCLLLLAAVGFFAAAACC